jgi:hypothetical protein
MKLDKNRSSADYIDELTQSVPVHLIAWNSSSPHDNLTQGGRRDALPFPEHMMDNKHED